MGLANIQRGKSIWGNMRFALVSAVLVVFAVVSSLLTIQKAGAETRTLRIYYTHTKESATITFKKNGKYIPSGLKKLNRILRDFRRNEPTKMDPELFDLVWEVYQKSGSRKPIHVISGYRSPRTNNMLRRRGRKVARNSQHTRGKALDFFLPDVKVTKLRALGLQAHGGGVGYYRGSFVHLDTGRVRHWPRMSRKQLARVFPKGRTIHIPSNGRPLKGYKIAAANLKKGLNYDGSPRRTAANASLLARLFKKSGNDGDENEGARAVAQLKAAPKPKPKPKPTTVAAKPAGSDPFALEVAAARKVQADEEKKAAVVVAEEGAIEDAVVEIAEVTVPRRRPREQVLQVPVPSVEEPAVNEDRLSPVDATQLALAQPQAETPSVQAVTAVDNQVSANAARRFSQSEEQAINDLKSRIKTALARQRQLTAAELAVESQAENTLGAQLARLQRAQLSSGREGIVQNASLVPASLPTENSFQVPTPEWRQEPAAIDVVEEQVAALPQPQENPVTTPSERVIQALEGELKLGNLDGRKVREWAVATSTRVGPIAVLSAPQYMQGTRRAAPVSVYSAGFAHNRPPLRADRFSGRALTRVAFAYFTDQ